MCNEYLETHGAVELCVKIYSKLMVTLNFSFDMEPVVLSMASDTICFTESFSKA